MNGQQHTQQRRIESVAIIGAGALGIMYGKLINDALGRERVWFVADDRRVDHYRRNGVFANDEPCGFNFATPAQIPTHVDLVIFTVKAMALDAALTEAAPLMGPHTVVISLLNGITSERIIGERVGHDKVLYSVCQGMDATRTSRNQVSYVHTGFITVGERDDTDTERLRAVEQLFDRCGIAHDRRPPILRHLWSKFMLNVGVNQTCAVMRGGYGRIHTDPKARDLMRRAMLEVVAVAGPEGVTLGDADIDAWFAIIDGLSPEGLTSMEQDVAAARPTEVELFAGTVRRLGRKHHIPTPTNDYLYDQLTGSTHDAGQP